MINILLCSPSMDRFNKTSHYESQLDELDQDDSLAPVMPAIDVVQQLIDEEERNKSSKSNSSPRIISAERHIQSTSDNVRPDNNDITATTTTTITTTSIPIRPNPLRELLVQKPKSNSDDYEFIPKSVILDVYSNDPEIKRFLKQLAKIPNEFGYNEQDYKCNACRRPIGMVFGESRLCHFDGYHYCVECHLNEKTVIPARVLCNWDFKTYPTSKRNKHFLSLIANEPMFELKQISPLLYEHCNELKEVDELRSQAFFIRSYCFTCVQERVSQELTKLVWPREHLIKQTDIYSIDDLIQIKSGQLKATLRNVISFGRQHVLSCMLCCLKGFICELCKSSQIIYPFDTNEVHRCKGCQSIYHKECFKSQPVCDACPRCVRLKAREDNSNMIA